MQKEGGADRKRTEAIRPLAETAANLKQNVLSSAQEVKKALISYKGDISISCR